jgi:hypothetical protein
MNSEKNFVVFSQRLAATLMLGGCKLHKVSPSKEDNSKNVFFFDDNEKVRELVREYKLNQNK